MYSLGPNTGNGCLGEVGPEARMADCRLLRFGGVSGSDVICISDIICFCFSDREVCQQKEH